jgi:hypothetical protein
VLVRVSSGYVYVCMYIYIHRLDEFCTVQYINIWAIRNTGLLLPRMGITPIITTMRAPWAKLHYITRECQDLLMLLST